MFDQVSDRIFTAVCAQRQRVIRQKHPRDRTASEHGQFVTDITMSHMKRSSHYIDLSDDDVRALTARAGKAQSFDVNQVIHYEGGPFDGLYNVGAECLYSSSYLLDGQRRIDQLYLPGDVIGLCDLAFFGNTRTLVTVMMASLLPFPGAALVGRLESKVTVIHSHRLRDKAAERRNTGCILSFANAGPEPVAKKNVTLLSNRPTRRSHHQVASHFGAYALALGARPIHAHRPSCRRPQRIRRCAACRYR